MPLLVAGTDRIVHSLGQLYAVKADGTYDTSARDALGSVRAEVSGTGRLTNAYDYATYGALRASLAGPPRLLGYTGELTDPSGLIYLRARWYDPGAGRLMTRDDFPGAVALPVSLNLYAYAYANPVLLTDPTGQCPPCVLAAAVVGIKLGLFVTDVASTAETLADPGASKAEKAIVRSLFFLGLAGSSGGATVGRGALQAAKATGIASRITRYTTHGLEQAISRATASLRVRSSMLYATR